MIEAPSASSGNTFCTVNSVPPHVDAEDVVEMLLGYSGEGSCFADASVRHEDIDPAPAGSHHLNQALEVSEVGNVTLYAGSVVADHFHRSIEFLLTAAGHKDIRAFGDKAAGRGQSYARAASGDDCDLSFEFSHGVSPRKLTLGFSIDDCAL
jgi:hypothetical protein